AALEHLHARARRQRLTRGDDAVGRGDLRTTGDHIHDWDLTLESRCNHVPPAVNTEDTEDTEHDSTRSRRFAAPRRIVLRVFVPSWLHLISTPSGIVCIHERTPLPPDPGSHQCAGPGPARDRAADDRSSRG